MAEKKFKTIPTKVTNPSFPGQASPFTANPFPLKADPPLVDSRLVLSSTLHFVLHFVLRLNVEGRLSVEGRLRPEGSEVE